MTLAGDAVKVGQAGPRFHRPFLRRGLEERSRWRISKGKPSIISVVPSLDTGVCKIQTKKFNEELASLERQGQRRHDQPRPALRHESLLWHRGSQQPEGRQRLLKSQLRPVAWGMRIEELGLLARSVFVLDQDRQRSPMPKWCRK